MLTAAEARKQSKNKIKEWLESDLSYLDSVVQDTITQKDETFVFVDIKLLHKDALTQLLSELKKLGYKAFLSGPKLMLQWGKPLEESQALSAPEENEEEDDSFDFVNSDGSSYEDDL